MDFNNENRILLKTLIQKMLKGSQNICDLHLKQFWLKTKLRWSKSKRLNFETLELECVKYIKQYENTNCSQLPNSYRV